MTHSWGCHQPLFVSDQSVKVVNSESLHPESSGDGQQRTPLETWGRIRPFVICAGQSAPLICDEPHMLLSRQGQGYEGDQADRELRRAGPVHPRVPRNLVIS